MLRPLLWFRNEVGNTKRCPIAARLSEAGVRLKGEGDGREEELRLRFPSDSRGSQRFATGGGRFPKCAGYRPALPRRMRLQRFALCGAAACFRGLKVKRPPFGGRYYYRWVRG